MPSRSGVDGQQGSQWIVELKSVPRGSATGTAPVWLTSLMPARARWLHVLSLVCLLIIGATVPGFLKWVAILLASLAVAIAVFVLLVQLPVGYLVHRLRDFRQGKGTKRRTPRGATSNGL